MSDQITPRPDPVQPGYSLEAKHVDLLYTSLTRLRVAPAFEKLGYACDGPLCICEGDDDCNDMFTTAGCGDIAQCYSDGQGGVVCVCLTI
jgi:hypothetical protein